jgi:DNA-binding GntR family transcriptional regulator
MPLPEDLGSLVTDGGSSMREHAFQTLWEAIYDGTLEPGEKLSDAQLVAWLGMSRQPIRHALQRLADLGLVVLTNGRPPRVAPLDPRAMNHALVLSGMFNLYAVERTVGRLGPQQLDALDVAARDIASAAATNAHAWMAESIRAFFEVFTDALKNPVLREQTELLTYELARLLVPGASLIDPDSLPAPIAELRDAAWDGDVKHAVSIARAFYMVTRANFVDHFRSL